MRTKSSGLNPEDSLGNCSPDTTQTQTSCGAPSVPPERLTYHGAEAVLYPPTASYLNFRLCFRADGKRVTRVFKSRKQALAAARDALRNIQRGSASVATLTKADADSFQFALAELARLRDELNAGRKPEDAGRVCYTIRDAISEYCEARRCLPSGSLAFAAKLYGGSHTTIQRIELPVAVDEFNREREGRTKAEEGRRSALCARAVYQDKLRLKRLVAFAKRVVVFELRTVHFDEFFATEVETLSPKTRNHFRCTFSVFIKWCVRKGYLAESHGLHRSEGLFPGGKAKEQTEAGEIAVYTAGELRALLNTADGPLLALIAIAAFAGLRTEELLRLTWADVWWRTGYIRVPAFKAKTRSRRLVPIVPALAGWLGRFRSLKEGKLWKGKAVSFHENMVRLFAKAGVTKRDNALRHSFISCRLAKIHNEHHVAAEAGTSVQMIHQHYRELVTPEEAEEFFGVLPPSIDGVLHLPASA